MSDETVPIKWGYSYDQETYYIADTREEAIADALDSQCVTARTNPDDFERFFVAPMAAYDLQPRLLNALDADERYADWYEVLSADSIETIAAWPEGFDDE